MPPRQQGGVNGFPLLSVTEINPVPRQDPVIIGATVGACVMTGATVGAFVITGATVGACVMTGAAAAAVTGAAVTGAALTQNMRIQTEINFEVDRRAGGTQPHVHSVLLGVSEVRRARTGCRGTPRCKHAASQAGLQLAQYLRNVPVGRFVIATGGTT